MLSELGWILTGLVLLCFGAEGLVRGGAALAIRLGVSPLIVGLTIVAYGTSSPEMVVSVEAAAAGRGSLAVSNVVGSNILNVALILGLGAVLRPIRTDSQMVRREIPVMIALSVGMVLILADRELSRWEGGLLLIALLVYTWRTVEIARRQRGDRLADEFAAELPAPRGSMVRDAVFIVGGLALLILGGRFFVDGAVGMARHFGWSEVLIGLTIVALGTSLPELATSLMAILRRENDISVGNVVGSNIFNIAGILGLAGVLCPVRVTDLRWVDLGVALGLAVVLLPMLRSGQGLSRWEGALLLAGYGGYVVTLMRGAGV